MSSSQHFGLYYWHDSLRVRGRGSKRKAKGGKTTPQLMWRITRDDERSAKQMCVKSKIMFVCAERKRRDVCRAIPGYRKGIRFTSYGEHPSPPHANELFIHSFLFFIKRGSGSDTGARLCVEETRNRTDVSAQWGVKSATLEQQMRRSADTRADAGYEADMETWGETGSQRDARICEPAVCHLPSVRKPACVCIHMTDGDNLWQRVVLHRDKKSIGFPSGFRPPSWFICLCNRSDRSPWISQRNRRRPWNWRVCTVRNTLQRVCVGVWKRNRETDGKFSRTFKHLLSIQQIFTHHFLKDCFLDKESNTLGFVNWWRNSNFLRLL